MKRKAAGCGISCALVLCWSAATGWVWGQTPAQTGAASGPSTGSPVGGAEAAPTVSSAVAANPALAQGLAALKAEQPRQALLDFQQVLKSDPTNVAANLLASTAAVELFQGQPAVEYAEKARQLDPQNWKIHTTLVAAYAAAAMNQQRDRERVLLEQLHRNGPPDARQATGFLIEMFPLNAYRVDAVEYFEPVGKFHTYYRFLVRRADGHRVWEVDVESDDFDQKSWADAHAEDAAGGARQFQLTGHGENNENVEYRNFSGHPDYDNIRVMVVESLRTRGVPGA